MHGAIILDGQLKSALAAARSLGVKGIHASVGAERSTATALHSRYVATQFVYPSPYADRDAFVRAVMAEAVRMGGKPVVYAFSDATYLALYHAREACERHMTLVYPPAQSVEIAFDKAATYSLARVSGVPTITTYTPERMDELVRLAPKLTYPVVVKARQSVTWRGERGVFGSATFVHSPDDLRTVWESMKHKLGEAPLIQDFVRGEEYGVEMLTDAGTVHARVVHRRIRSLSPTGGASVLKETLGESHEVSVMCAYAERLVRELTWTGPIMVEFKVDADSCKPFLMEINGRFWGSLPLSVAAGVDVPHRYYQFVTGEVEDRGMITAKAGVVTRHVLGDVLHLFRVWFGRSPMRRVLYPERLSALRDFFILPKGTRSDVWSWRDPKPAFFEVFDMIKKHLWK